MHSEYHLFSFRSTYDTKYVYPVYYTISFNELQAFDRNDRYVVVWSEDMPDSAANARTSSYYAGEWRLV